MSKLFFTSDTHFFHKNILKFCPTTRRGESVEEMTELMVQAWNAKVKPDDVVYHLGDVSFGLAEKTVEVLNRLNGTLHLIEGNHDKGVTQGAAAKRWASINKYKSIRIDGVEVVMFHYPIIEWDKMHYGSYHLFGHVHGKDMGLSDRRAMDVGVDSRPGADMAPWSWDEVHTMLKERKIFSHH